ncbi:hypothetical protein B8V81_2884 [Paenibacillus pasadenensis]|uniref:Uncharacterized protein n=1 Tax=Paenibacillus pasadenensis TaxID=217090 RepID=A0A2N5N2A3_9BACL|nr:hypothetical protein B8V81_2884 [Paenibacillus pasadenensis]
MGERPAGPHKPLRRGRPAGCGRRGRWRRGCRERSRRRGRRRRCRERGRRRGRRRRCRERGRQRGRGGRRAQWRRRHRAGLLLKVSHDCSPPSTVV